MSGLGLISDLPQAVDTADVGRRAGELIHVPRSREAEMAALLTAVACLDLTSLRGDETRADIEGLCRRALEPLSPSLTQVLRGRLPAGSALPGHVAAVCVLPSMVRVAASELDGTPVAVSAAAPDFPRGSGALSTRVAEVRRAIADGAGEIEAVIRRDLAAAGEWHALLDELAALRQAAEGARLKIILAAGDLPSLLHVARAGWTALVAGADFLKTSTGREPVNARLDFGLVLAEQIARFHRLTGARVGLKPAGGLSRAEQSLEWLLLVERSLGPSWAVAPSTLRLGASGLLEAVAARLSQLAKPTSPSIPPRA